jgi:hypothetical protein
MSSGLGAPATSKHKKTASPGDMFFLFSTCRRREAAFVHLSFFQKNLEIIDKATFHPIGFTEVIPVTNL